MTEESNAICIGPIHLGGEQHHQTQGLEVGQLVIEVDVRAGFGCSFLTMGAPDDISSPCFPLIPPTAQPVMAAIPAYPIQLRHRRRFILFPPLG